MVVPSIIAILVVLIIFKFVDWVLKEFKINKVETKKVVQQVVDLSTLESEVDQTVEQNRQTKIKVDEAATKIDNLKNKL